MNDLIINEIFGGNFGNIVVFFLQLCPYLWGIGVILIVLKFVHLVIKKEINTMEDWAGYIFTRGGRLLIVTVFWLPASLPGFETLTVKSGSVTAPLGFSLLYTGAKASLGSADELSKSSKGVPFLELPTVFEKDSAQGATNMQETYKEFLSKDMVTQEQRAVGEGTFFGGQIKYWMGLTSLVSGVFTGSSAGDNLKNIQMMGGAMADSYITGDQSLAVVVRDFIISLLLPATIIITFYATLISLLLHFVFYSAWFFLSAFMLFFDGKKTVFYDNLIKVVSLMLAPVGLTCAYLVAEQGWIVFHTILEKFIFQAMKNADVGLIAHLMVAVIISFTFMGIIIKLFSSVNNFISNMLGSAFHAGL